MTVLILAQKKILSFRKVIRLQEILIEGMRHWTYLSQAVNKWLAAALIITGGVYLGMLYLTFKTGFELRGSIEESKRLEESLLLLETRTERAKSELSQNHQDILISMERVSLPKYITSRQIANLSQRHPP